jgi:MarR family 2-MHQ and catechol resistance regulon transcriptional repressor
MSDGCFDIREHAELREDHRTRGVAVERLDLVVHETEDVTARRVHPLARWRKDPHRRRQGPLVRTLEGELHDDDIADAEKPVQFAMHVRKRLCIDFDRLAQAGGAVGPAVRDADRHVGKRPVGREAVNPTLDVHLSGQFVRSANDLLVIHRKVLSVRSVLVPADCICVATSRRQLESPSEQSCGGHIAHAGLSYYPSISFVLISIYLISSIIQKIHIVMEDRKRPPEAVHAWLIMLRAWQSMSRYVIPTLLEEGLGESDFRVLEVLLHKGPMPVNAIGPKVDLNPGSVSVAVDRLYKKGFVSRVENSRDRRVRTVSLTERGRQMFVPLFRRHTALINRAFRDVSSEELQRLELILKRIGKRAESLAEKKGHSGPGKIR